ncbi:hypothetical protein V2J09_003943 [Rumex salicifolius]
MAVLGVIQPPFALLFPRCCVSNFFHVHSRSQLAIMPPSKTLMDYFQPPQPKRLKSSSAAGKFVDSGSSPADSCHVDSIEQTDAPSSSSVSAEERARMELSKSMAISKRNAKICLDRLSKSKEGRGHMTLDELLVEKTWFEVLPGELQKPYAINLCKFVEQEVCRGGTPVFPPSHLIFNALNTTPFPKVKVVILGQDPYHGPGQAMGLSFSVPEGVKIPSSLVNIFKELKQDLGCPIPSHGNLERWALQGVLLLNTVLTVRSHQANSHAKKGWEQFTDAVIRTLSEKGKGVVFLLWGNSAQEKARLIDATRHHILKAAHPSGLSAHRGFFGCRFSRKVEKPRLIGNYETPKDHVSFIV